MSPAARLPDWPARLGVLVQQRLGEPFAWGRNDCASFAADCVLAMTGVDVLGALRMPRADLRQAQRAARAAGGAQALGRCGLVAIAPALAQRGDLVLLRQDKRPVLAVCLGEDAVAPGEQGLWRARTADALKAWRV